VSVNSRVSGQQQALLHWKRAESATQEPVQTLVQAPVPLESAGAAFLAISDTVLATISVVYGVRDHHSAR
ncbi:MULTISPECIES: hypothetical protein, partial [unclassified Burkholderia]|uniref:hypothetical protein n=1 Tax=unclassified Burkholderia TaxID=2613784 RepID=UPI001ABADB4B